eukprot:3604184-Pleurochrysis_carterae.AAC.1
MSASARRRGSLRLRSSGAPRALYAEGEGDSDSTAPDGRACLCRCQSNQPASNDGILYTPIIHSPELA